jgi:hypothetical protein
MNAIDEAWDATKAYIKEKTNPFFATFIVVWIVQNWKAVYAFFFFGKQYTLDERIKWFETYWHGSFLQNLFYVIVISFAVLTITLVLINLSKLIIRFFADRVTPLIYKAVKPTNVVEREKYDEVVKRNVDLEKSIIDQRDLRIKAQREKETTEYNYINERSQIITQAREETVNLLAIAHELEVNWTKTFLSDLRNDISWQKDLKIERLITYGLILVISGDKNACFLAKTQKGNLLHQLLINYRI